jgi:hypothetical protein
LQNWYTNDVSLRYDGKNEMLPIYSTADAGAVTIPLSEFDIYMAIS